MSNVQPYKYKATGVGTFQVEGPGIEGCAPIWDHEDDAARCVLAMNNAWRASRKHAVEYLEARSQHFHKYSFDGSLSAVAVERWDVLEEPKPVRCWRCGHTNTVGEKCPC